MDKKYDIAIGIPSLNEQDSIKFVVESICQGLHFYYPNMKAIVINVDNNSTDNTKNEFLNSKSFGIEKKYINTNGLGKGLNILSFIEKVTTWEIPNLAIFDADLKSINPDWVKYFLNPIIHGKADFVTPIYYRNPYEGNATNHFCYPVLKAVFGDSVRQPIAGDFAFSLQYAKDLIHELRNDYTLGYGVDITMTCLALCKEKRITEITVGEKIHNPSFSKMIPIFKQEAIALTYMLNKNIKTISKGITVYISREKINTESYEEYYNSPSKADIVSRRRVFAELLMNTNFNYLLGNISKLQDFNQNKSLFTSKMWVITLEEFLRLVFYSKLDKSEIEKLIDELVVFYLARVLSYYSEIESTDSETIINKQGIMLRNKFLKI